MLWQRLLTGLVGIPVLLAVVYLGGWWLAGVVAALALVGLREFYRLAAARSLLSYPSLGYPWAVLTIAAAGSPYWTRFPWQVEAALMSLALIAVVSCLLAAPRPWQRPKLFATLMGQLYIAQLISYLPRLRGLEAPSFALSAASVTLDRGVVCVLLLLAVCWAMDTAAYGVGSILGRHKLCPTISPGKTVEGAVAGLLAAVGVTVAMGLWLGLPARHGVILGSVLGVMGQLGDLFESALKRRAGVKDSGAVLPGHGGVLDRFDSLLFNAPAAFFYLRFALGP